MPPTRLQKVQAYAEHLLDVFIGLREKYALLDPLIFDLSCLMDVSKIALDRDDRTPSVLHLVDSLSQDGVRDELREQFAVWHLAPTRGESREVIALLQAAERREEAERRERFDGHVAEVQDRWKSLHDSKVLQSCRTIRDKLLAHSELHHNGKNYEPLDVTSLGLKWGDLKQVISELEQIVNLLTLVFRNSSFAFDMLDEQLAKASDAFWAPTSSR